MSLRYAIVEDEPPARTRLHRLLKELAPDARCLWEAADGLEGLEGLRGPHPDLLFLDIEFPPAGAFGLLRRAREEGLTLPAIAFVTAFDQHALEAFRWAACDYLLKPVDRERLQETLARLVPRGAAPDLSLLLQAVDATRKKEAPERFTVLVKGRWKVLAWAEVTHLRTENRLLLAFTAEGHYPLDRSLDELEIMLSPRFLRTHRSAMVAVDGIRELLTESGGHGELLLRDGTRIPVSRDRMAEVRRRLG